MVSTIDKFNVLGSRDATKPVSSLGCFQGLCFALCPLQHALSSSTQVCLSRVFGSRDGAALPGWEEAVFHMLMAWDLDPKDEGLQLMDFS